MEFMEVGSKFADVHRRGRRVGERGLGRGEVSEEQEELPRDAQGCRGRRVFARRSAEQKLCRMSSDERARSRTRLDHLFRPSLEQTGVPDELDIVAGEGESDESNKGGLRGLVLEDARCQCVDVLVRYLLFDERVIDLRASACQHREERQIRNFRRTCLLSSLAMAIAARAPLTTMEWNCLRASFAG